MNQEENNSKQKENERYWYYPPFKDRDEYNEFVSDDADWEIMCRVYDAALSFRKDNEFAAFFPFFAMNLAYLIIESDDEKYRTLIRQANKEAKCAYSAYLESYLKYEQSN